MRQLALRRFPFLTLLLVLVLLLVAQVPDWGRGLIYDRQAILRGEFWRLAGCDLVHYSAAHLGWNLLPLVVFGGWFEATSRSSLVILLLLAPLANAVLLLRPEIVYFAGASGFVIALVAALCLAKLATADTKWPWLLLLLLLAGKVSFELLTARSIFVPGGPPLLPLAHLLGLLTALLVSPLSRRIVAG